MRKLFLALAALAALMGSPAATDPRDSGVADPRAFVTETYAAYARSANDPPPEPRSAYSARLTALFDAYETWARGHDDLVGSLDFDWWVNAQDWEISDVAVTELSPLPDRRIVVARWTNYGRADSSRFEFVRANGRWHLDEIVNGSGGGEDGWTLSALLRQRP